MSLTSSKTRKPDLSDEDSKSSRSSLIVAWVAIAVSAVAAAFTGLMYLNQRSANAAQIQADRDAARVSLEHDADRVSYFSGIIKGTGRPRIIITNRAIRSIRDVVLSVPTGPKSGWSFRLTDLPPCSAEPVTVQNLVWPELSWADVSKSELTFLDANGHSWMLTASGQLTQRRGPNPSTVNWMPSAKLQRANDCS